MKLTASSRMQSATLVAFLTSTAFPPKAATRLPSGSSRVVLRSCRVAEVEEGCNLAPPRSEAACPQKCVITAVAAVTT